MYIKPKIGQKFYYIYEKGIFSDTVFLIGKEEFCGTDPFIEMRAEEVKRTYRFDEVNKEWFQTLEAAKATIMQLYSDCDIIRVDDWWSIQEDEDL